MSDTSLATDADATPPLIPENVSTYGAEIDGLFYLILVVTSVALVIVLGLLAVFVLKYGYRDGRQGVYTHGHRKLEWMWTIGTATVLVFLALVQQDTWVKVKQELPPEGDAFLVRVFGEQYLWHFVYAGADGKFEPHTLQDRAQDNHLGLRDPRQDISKSSLMVPVNRKVLLQLNSLGKYDPTLASETLPVVHSFFAPNLRLKQDLVPYHPGYVWFEATKTGTYEVVCAELCGLGHYRMRAKLEVVTAEELTQALGYDWTTPTTFAGVGGSEATTTITSSSVESAQKASPGD